MPQMPPLPCGGGSGRRKLPACELLFECKGRFCTTHTVSFANEMAILDAKVNIWYPPGLTDLLLCFARLYLNVIPLCLWSLPSPLFNGIRKTMSGFPCQTYRHIGAGKVWEKSKGYLHRFYIVWCTLNAGM